MSRQIKHFYEFGPFRLDTGERLLWRAGEAVPLTPKAFDLLQALVEQHGHLIDKEELLKAVWPDAFVEEANLSHNISQIRKILGDGENGQGYIQTVPKRGYRFVGAVREARQDLADGNKSDGLGQPARLDEGVAEAGEGLGERQLTEPSPAVSGPKLLPKLVWAAGLLTLAAVCVDVVWLVQSRGRTSQSSQVLIPLTAHPGWEGAPSFSPEGNQVVFAWNGEKQDNFDIYVKLIGTGGLFRLTDHPNAEGSPVWSPDGRWIAFQRELEQDRVAVLLKPAIGGAERTLAEVRRGSIGLRRFFIGRSLAWHPAGEWLAVNDRISAEGPTFGLFLLSVETGEKRQLTFPPPGSFGDFHPSFSPDGLHLAFVRRAFSGPSTHLYVLNLGEDLVPRGEPKPVTFENRMIEGPVWIRDGREILFVSVAQGRSLWRMAASGIGKPEPLTFAMGEGRVPAISKQGNRLAYVSLSVDVNIWRLNLEGRRPVAGAAANLISSTRVDQKPSFSADGKKIVFSSYRSGTPEIWICEADGSNPIQLTALEAATVDNPRWSPDGRQIVFDSTNRGNSDIYLIGPQGGKPRLLAGSAAEDFMANFSRDGRWIYFSSDRGGAVQLWKMPADGGEALQVTKNEGRLAVESIDQRFLYYLKGREPRYSLWRMSLPGGEETRVLESVYARNFEVVNDGVYFIPEVDPQGRYAIHFLSFATGTTQPIASIAKETMYGFAVSPDEKTILYTQLDQEGSDLMLVENFR